MISIKLINFMGKAICRSEIYSSKESFIPITYDLSGGNIYGLISDFGRGSWALATCVGGMGDCVDGEIYLDDKKIEHKELANYSCYMGQTTFSEISLGNGVLSAKTCIERALSISKLPNTLHDIKNSFCLSDERFERDLKYVSGEIWRISAAIGFALDKKIFCYPWLNTHDAMVSLDYNILDLLRRSKKIVLIPACRGFVKTPYKNVLNHIIDFHAYQKSYFHISSEERKKLRKMKYW